MLTKRQLFSNVAAASFLLTLPLMVASEAKALGHLLPDAIGVVWVIAFPLFVLAVWVAIAVRFYRDLRQYLERDAARPMAVVFGLMLPVALGTGFEVATLVLWLPALVSADPSSLPPSEIAQTLLSILLGALFAFAPMWTAARILRRHYSVTKQFR